MLISERRIQLDGSVGRWSRTLVQPGLRVQLLGAAGCETDTRPIQQAFGELAPPHHSLTVVLEGEYESEGTGHVGPSRIVHEVRERWLERWIGNRQRFVVVTWNGGSGATTGVERLGPKALGIWRELAEKVADATEADAGRVADMALVAARAAGAPAPSRKLAPVPEQVLRVSHALNRAFTNLHELPQWVDLEHDTGLSSRHLRRLIGVHAGWLPHDGLRGCLHRHRLSLALSLLGNEGTNVKEIAAALGYGSDRALHTALRRAAVRSG